MNELAELRMEEYNRLSEKYKKLEAITVELLEENRSRSLHKEIR